MSFQIQLLDRIDTSFMVDVYVVDANAVPTATLDGLRASGRRTVCYFSAGTWEPWREDAYRFPPSVLGTNPIAVPDERWLDTRDQRVRDLMVQRLVRVRAKNCDAVHLGLVDLAPANSGFAISAQDYMDYARFLAAAARAQNLGVLYESDDRFAVELSPHFDALLIFNCINQGRCAVVAPVRAAGKAEFAVEIAKESDVVPLCAEARRLGFDMAIKRRDLGPYRVGCP